MLGKRRTAMISCVNGRKTQVWRPGAAVPRLNPSLPGRDVWPWRTMTGSPHGQGGSEGREPPRKRLKGEAKRNGGGRAWAERET